MTNDYMILVTERLEHKHKMRSLARAANYGAPIEVDQPGWVSRRLAQLLQMAVALVMRIKSDRDRSAEALPVTQK